MTDRVNALHQNNNSQGVLKTDADNSVLREPTASVALFRKNNHPNEYTLFGPTRVEGSKSNKLSDHTDNLNRTSSLKETEDSKNTRTYKYFFKSVVLYIIKLCMSLHIFSSIIVSMKFTKDAVHEILTSRV